MKRIYRWHPTEGDGMEHAEVDRHPEGITVRSAVIGHEGGEDFALVYHLLCTADWQVRELKMELLGQGKTLHLIKDQDGWRDSLGHHLTELGNCIDVDITATPLTNTLPIRRLALAVGQSAEVEVAYVSCCPALSLSVSCQRYTRLAETQYRFELLDGTFSAEITVDEEGFVVEYPGLFQEVKN